MTESQTVRHGRATVTWGPRYYGPDTIIANCPVESFIDLVIAVCLACEQHLAEIDSQQTTFTIRCRDRRYCANASITITAADQDAAHMQARNQGWLIHTAEDLVSCPACQTGRHPRRTP
ncbi:hypothetical protein [Mycobacterium paragordonae]|uniref:hypothetical protein n=1 Tax=Mycobacterium paragordonae TaxID=1389713 RepID=UPI003986F27B